MSATSLRSGYVTLLSVLIVAAIAASTVLILFVTSLNASLNSGDTANGKIAKAAAEACAELALQKLSSGLAIPCSGCIGDYPLSVSPSQKCAISAFSGTDGPAPANGWTIRSQASDPKNTITKYLEVKATRANAASEAVVTAWKECLDFSTSPCPLP